MKRPYGFTTVKVLRSLDDPWFGYGRRTLKGHHPRTRYHVRFGWFLIEWFVDP